MPQPGKNWYDSLRNEALRLNRAFEIENYEISITGGKDTDWRKKYGYRGNNYEKHLYFSKLNSVRKVLRDKNNELTKWNLYDGGRNTVLNLKETKYSWKDVPNLGKNQYYWEFNDNDFTLKVRYEEEFGDNKIIEWIVKKQASLKQELTWPDGVKLIYYSKPRSNAKRYVSILRWELKKFDSAESVADQVVKIIEMVDNSRILDN